MTTMPPAVPAATPTQPALVPGDLGYPAALATAKALALPGPALVDVARVEPGQIS